MKQRLFIWMTEIILNLAVLGLSTSKIWFEIAFFFPSKIYKLFLKNV